MKKGKLLWPSRLEKEMSMKSKTWVDIQKYFFCLNNK